MCCFITKNRHGCDSRQVCFQTERTTYIHSYAHCVYILGALHTVGRSSVLLANLKIGLMHYENKKKRHTLTSIKCSTYMLVPALCFAFDGVDIHSGERGIIFNQFVYAGCAAKSVKLEPNSETLKQLFKCFEKPTPVFEPWK